MISSSNRINSMPNEFLKKLSVSEPDTNKNVFSIPLLKYLKWAEEKDGDTQLTLPPIQRGFVWKPKQIQDLWDSLLRLMPIGSVLVQPFKGEHSRSLSSNTGNEDTNTNLESGYHLLDGQQRTISMLLGLSNPRTGSSDRYHKLWIDFGTDGKDGNQFQFRVTTLTKPFGYKDDGSKLSSVDTLNALEKWDTVLVNLNQNLPTKEHIPNKIKYQFEHSKPWKSSGDEFLFEVNKIIDLFNNKNVEGVIECISKSEGVNVSSEEEWGNVEKRIRYFCKSIIKLQSQWMSVIVVPTYEDVSFKSDEVDPTVLLFERVSLGGTKLTNEELLFSMIKKLWPESHNIVHKLQDTIGSFLKPTEYVLTAYRIAASQVESISDKHTPTVKDFHKNLNILLGYNGKLKELIESKGNTESIFVSCFSKLLDTISYSSDNTVGFPNAYLPYLDKHLIQVLVYWFYLRKDDTSTYHESRGEIIRFILFWQICKMKRNYILSASQICFEYLTKNYSMNSNFPAFNMYKELTSDENSHFYSFISVDDITDVNKDASLRTSEERAKYYFCEKESIYYNFRGNKSLLLWFQRSWIHSWYEKQNIESLSITNEDSVPYDFDHIIPQSNWSSFTGRTKDIDCDKKFGDLWIRRSLGNSIGNYQVLTLSSNRSRGDTGFFEFIDKDSTDVNRNDISFNPSPEEESWWRTASAENSSNKGVWTDERLLAFQASIESRVIYLYTRMIEDAGFSSWGIKSSQFNAPK